MEKGSALIHAPFSFQVIYSKNQKTIAMIQSHHRILSLDLSHCVTWFIELFFTALHLNVRA